MTEKDLIVRLGYLAHCVNRGIFNPDSATTPQTPISQVFHQQGIPYEPLYNIYTQSGNTFVTNGERILHVGTDITREDYNTLRIQTEGFERFWRRDKHG